MSTIEQNKAAVRACFEHATTGELERFGEVVAPGYVSHPDDIRGIEGLTAMVEGYRAALPDLHVTVEHQFTEGDYVATRSVVRGTHDGELMGTPPTGREVAFTVLTISRCRDGKVEEEWEIADTMSLLAQVGALPGVPA